MTPSVKNKIQGYFESQRNGDTLTDPPEEDSLDEYSYYFQKAYNDLSLRSEYIERKLANAKPTYGYKIMAVLMKMGMLRYVLTTNFDRLIEDAAALVYQSTSNLHIASIDNNFRGSQFIQHQKTPVLIKLHGDFHSLFMKNTTEELLEQDTKLRMAFKNLCENYGLAFIGYSGRDDSIMEVINEALDSPLSFPNGLYWFVRSGSVVNSAVKDLLEKAINNGIKAYLVELESFEETFSSLIKLLQNVPEDAKKLLESSNQRITHQPIPNKGKRTPVLRLNALKIKDYPSIARLIECDCGNTKDILEIVKQARANILCIRDRYPALHKHISHDKLQLRHDWNRRNHVLSFVGF